jgi:hypothetical protein
MPSTTQPTITDTIQDNTPHDSTTSALLQLPDELLLQIALELRDDIAQPDPQRNMRNLATTCKTLTSIAREALFHAPILRSSKADLFLDVLFTYPTLRNKIKSLTIETKEAQAEFECVTKYRGEVDNLVPCAIPRLKPGLLRNCITEVQKLQIGSETKEWWIADLQATTFPTHGTLLTLILIMLPHVEELYLGGSMLFNFPHVSRLVA